MKRAHIIVGFLLALILLSGVSLGSREAVAQGSERCATVDDAPAGLKRQPSQDELPTYQTRAAAFASGSAAPRVVQVAFHVLQNAPTEALVTDAQIVRQIAVMNNA